MARRLTIYLRRGLFGVGVGVLLTLPLWLLCIGGTLAIFRWRLRVARNPEPWSAPNGQARSAESTY